jgi:hypothetical protein
MLKKILFWILYIPLGIIFLGLCILQEIARDGEELFQSYERWSFGEKKKDIK